MGASFATPVSVCVQRRNPVRVPRRDILVVASDTPTLALTVYQQDTDTAPIDVSAAALTMSIYRERDVRHGWGCWDYGFNHEGAIPYIAATFTAAPVDPTNGRVDMALAANPAQWIVGRFWYQIVMSCGLDGQAGVGVMIDGVSASANYAQGNYTILEGVIDFPPGAFLIVGSTPQYLGNIGVM